MKSFTAFFYVSTYFAVNPGIISISLSQSVFFIRLDFRKSSVALLNIENHISLFKKTGVGVGGGERGSFRWARVDKLTNRSKHELTKASVKCFFFFKNIISVGGYLAIILHLTEEKILSSQSGMIKCDETPVSVLNIVFYFDEYYWSVVLFPSQYQKIKIIEQVKTFIFA